MSSKPSVIAALFVHPSGVYYGQPGIDPWDETRDARKYNGPFPVIAHPPCERWGAFSTGGFRNRGRYKTGDDNGCFESALSSVRKFGGVIEHPAHSKAWKHFGLPRPTIHGQWSSPDGYGGRTACVYQSAYGHKLSKPTWLYGVGINFDITLRADKPRGSHVIVRPINDRYGRPELPQRERHLSPEPFRDLLISLVRK